ncbi:MAG: hypothetical protein V4440_12200 [Pseudomonadota bacterium]
MSYWVAGAMVVSAIGSAVSSNKASKQNAAGVKSGLDQSKSITDKARADVISLFDNSSKRANVGLQSSLDFYKQNAQKRMQPFLQGNQAAQNVVGLGARQANNAILGLPVDMSFTNQPQVQADYSGIQGATLPVQGGSFAEQEAAKAAAEQAAQSGQAAGGIQGQSKANTILTAGGLAANPVDMINPLTLATNPLGLGSKITDKIPGSSAINKIVSKDPVTKALRKLF